MIYVVSGTYGEFTAWINHHRLKNGTEARYVHDSRAFRGRRGNGDKYALLGSWRQRENIQELVDSLRCTDFQQIKCDAHIRGEINTGILAMMKAMVHSNTTFGICLDGSG